MFSNAVHRSCVCKWERVTFLQGKKTPWVASDELCFSLSMRTQSLSSVITSRVHEVYSSRCFFGLQSTSVAPLIYFSSTFNPSPHTQFWQQTTLENSLHKCEKFPWIKVYWNNRVENIVAKWEIGHYVQFLLFSSKFSNFVCCRFVKMRLLVRKGYLFF